VKEIASGRNGRNEVGAEVLLAISREFGKSLEWLLTGQKKGPVEICAELRVLGREALSYANRTRN